MNACLNLIRGSIEETEQNGSANRSHPQELTKRIEANMKRQLRTQRRTKNVCDYDLLEPKKLLAGITLNGTDGDDMLAIEFTNKGNLVNVTLNGQLTEGLDITDGLTIDLGEGNDVAVIVNSMGMLNPGKNLEVHNAEEIRATTGGNLWHVTQNENGNIEGSFNDSIHFFDATTLVGGNGRDTFNIYSLENGTVRGGEGNDAFRFGRGDISATASVMGESGNDHFSIHGSHVAGVDGGEGFDRLSFRSYDGTAVNMELEIGESLRWKHNDSTIDVERVGGAKGSSDLSNGSQRIGNTVSYDLLLDSEAIADYEFKFIMDGKFTYVFTSDTDYMTFVSFDTFALDPEVNDIFYVRSTANDFRILSATTVQISSAFDIAEGNLDGINHSIGINDLVLPTSADVKLVDGGMTRVIVSDQAGTGTLFNLTGNSLTGFSGGGQINVGQYGSASSGLAVTDTFLDVYGSNSASDRFDVVQSTETISTALGDLIVQSGLESVAFYGMGGDDVASFVDSRTSLHTYSEFYSTSYSFVGGEGEDRLVLNDHNTNIELDRSLYRSYVVRDQTVDAFFTDLDGSIINRTEIGFDDSTDVVRINGTKDYRNHFVVAPGSSRIVVSSPEENNEIDTLVIESLAGEFIAGDENDGLWLFDEFEPIFFYDIEVSTVLGPDDLL